MNIIISDRLGNVSCRPDTTWERENKDLYSPDFVAGYGFAPVLFARVCKAGKRIGAKFAGRYYDTVNYGVLLYPEVCDSADKTENSIGDNKRGNEEPYLRKESRTQMTIMDHTSVLPFPMHDRAALESGENIFGLSLDGKIIYSTNCGNEAMIEEALVNATRYISVRIGDIIAVELQDISPLLPNLNSNEIPSTQNPSSAPIQNLTHGANPAAHRLSATFCGNPLFDFSIK